MDEIFNCDCIEGMRELPVDSVDAIVTGPAYGLNFMGKDWDHGVPGEQFWSEALRVAKPGAHLLSFGGTRTYHRLACAIEDSGWEIRDCLGWLYGSGFPKSMDVSKAIDKSLGAERATVRIDAKKVRNPKSINSGHGVDGGDRPWMQLAREQGFYEKPGDEPASEAAKKWQGWGTALKPAWEPIIMARKPLDGTVAHNVMTYGTGAINIDACRIPTNGEKFSIPQSDPTKRAGVGADLGITKSSVENFQASQRASIERTVSLGRFPANIIHDGSDEVLSVFPDSKGQQGDVKGTEPSRTGGEGTNCYGRYDRVCAPRKRGDSGSAARFFYCAKASKKDRGEGNNHPTVKPQALMQYLIRLVTPEGAVVLDPFLGSGSTAVAAMATGRHYLGYELSPEYFDIARARLDAAKKEDTL